MSETKIEWATHTENYQAGCTKLSPACTHCYALPMSIRQANMGHADRYDTVTNGNLKQPAWNGTIVADLEALRHIFQGIRAARKPRRIFLNSMTDTFHKDAPAEALELLAEEIKASTGNTNVPHVLMLLTKRPERLRTWQRAHFPDGLPSWVWVGSTVEDQKRADERIPELLEVRATTRFLSMEPLLGAVDLNRWLPAGGACWYCQGCRTFFSPGRARNVCPVCERVGYWTGGHAGNPPIRPGDFFPRQTGLTIHWVIAGGESGNKARPSRPEWFRAIRDQCAAAGTAFHFKQHGAFNEHGQRVGKHVAGRVLDGRTWDEVPHA